MHVHDFVQCKCPNRAFVDGGGEYMRCGFATSPPVPYERTIECRRCGEVEPEVDMDESCLCPACHTLVYRWLQQ